MQNLNDVLRAFFLDYNHYISADLDEPTARTFIQGWIVRSGYRNGVVTNIKNIIKKKPHQETDWPEMCRIKEVYALLKIREFIIQEAHISDEQRKYWLDWIGVGISGRLHNIQSN